MPGPENPEPTDSANSSEFSSKACLLRELGAIAGHEKEGPPKVALLVDDARIGEITPTSLVCERCDATCLVFRDDDWRILRMRDHIIGPNLDECPDKS